MKDVRLLYAWQQHSKGAVVSLPSAYADAMVRNRQAEFPTAQKAGRKKKAAAEAPHALF